MDEYGKHAHEFVVNLVENAGRNLKARAEKGHSGLVFADACREFLKKTGYSIDYEQKNNPDFHDLRTKLNTEAGLVISNHPGLPDTFAVLSALERDDTLILANEKVAEHGAKIFGEKYFVPASHDPHEAMKTFRRAIGHISNGGLFVMFPSGSRKPEFKSGLAFILKHIHLDDMVYCFNVNSSDVSSSVVSAKMRVVGAAVEAGVGGIKNPFKAFPQTVRVNEKYTNALEWQKLLPRKAGERKEVDEVLQRHYEEMFVHAK